MWCHDSPTPFLLHVAGASTIGLPGSRPSLACPQEASHMWSDETPSAIVRCVLSSSNNSRSQRRLFPAGPLLLLSSLRLLPPLSSLFPFSIPPFPLPPLLPPHPPLPPPPPLLPHRLLRGFPASAAASSADESWSSGDRVVARSSSELQMGRLGGSRAGVAGDEKLRSLRELFTSPDVVIDAYIIPSWQAFRRTPSDCPAPGLRLEGGSFQKMKPAAHHHRILQGIREAAAEEEEEEGLFSEGPSKF